MALKCHFHGYFNSQPHKEADGQSANSYIKGLIISTHSLTRRLTLSLYERHIESLFQLTASQGG